MPIIFPDEGKLSSIVIIETIEVPEDNSIVRLTLFPLYAFISIEKLHFESVLTSTKIDSPISNSTG